MNGLNHLGSAAALLVPSLELVSFGLAGITANRADIDHTVPEFNEGSTHVGKALEFGNVSQAELCKLLVLLLTEPLDEGVGGELFAQTEGSEAVFGEAEIKEGSNREGGCSQLFLLFDQIRTPNLERVSRERQS